MEGVAFSLRHCFEAANGLPTDPVWLTGGGAENELWRQIIADVLGAPIIISNASDQGLWGASCIGRAAIAGDDPCEMAKRSQARHTNNPNMKNHAQYTQAYQRYLGILNAIKPVWDLPNIGEFSKL